MTRISGLITAILISSVVSYGDDLPARLLAGTIVAGNGPVADARILIGPAAQGLMFVDKATATTDARGKYTSNLSGFPWSAARTRVIVLAPGFKPAERFLEPGAGAATIDALLEPLPWKEIAIRTADPSGKPVPNVPITCKVAGATWAKVVADADGQCKVSMAPTMTMTLAAKPEGARPVDLFLAVTENEPPTIVVPVMPPVRGRVVDLQGRPVPDLAVGRCIIFRENGVGEVLPFSGGMRPKTDSEGKFSIAPPLMLHADESQKARERWIHSIAVADASFRRVGSQTFRPLKQVDPVEIILMPTRRVRIPIAFGATGARTNIELSSAISTKTAAGVELRFLSRSGREKTNTDPPAGELFVEEYLPIGKYLLEVDVFDTKTEQGLGEAKCDIDVPAGEGDIELPALPIEAPHFHKMVGKPAMEIDATDLDGKPVKLADLRGSVVIFDFWGYWCGPCIWNMPKLMELRKKFDGRPLTIIAFHDASVSSRSEYEKKTAMARERIWGGKDLTLRVLLDQHDPENGVGENPSGSGMTVKRYGITGFPTTLVIDHEGKMVDKVGHTEHDRLESLVKELVEKAEAARPSSAVKK